MKFYRNYFSLVILRNDVGVGGLDFVGDMLSDAGSAIANAVCN